MRKLVVLMWSVLAFWPHVLFGQIPPPGKLTNVYTVGAMSFNYPQNWRVLEQRGKDDVLLGPPEALAHWETCEKCANHFLWAAVKR